MEALASDPNLYNVSLKNATDGSMTYLWAVDRHTYKTLVSKNNLQASTGKSDSGPDFIWTDVDTAAPLCHPAMRKL